MKLIHVPEVFGISFGLMAFTTFVYDTLDVCVRLGRYILTELTGLKSKAANILGALLTAFVPLIFVFIDVKDASGNIVAAWRVFWGTFGASNQLLAGLALIGVSVWLYADKKKGNKLFLVAFIPAILMFLMSNWALLSDIYKGFVLHQGTMSIPVVSIILMVLSVFVAVETVVTLAHKKRGVTV
jgi:carbon starvation protein